jgi:hypothetical protein
MFTVKFTIGSTIHRTTFQWKPTFSELSDKVYTIIYFPNMHNIVIYSWPSFLKLQMFRSL